MEQRRRQSYEDRFLNAYERLEKPLFKLVLLGFLLVIIAQVILAVPGGRQLLSAVDRLEGERVTEALPTAAANDQPPTLTIRTVGVEGGSLPKAWVKINGVPVASFAKDEVTVRVRENDVLVIDTSTLPGLYRFEVDTDSSQISYPVSGTLVESNEGKNAEVGPVHFVK